MPHEQAEANAVLQEVHILASLEHPFIVRYYDSFVETRKLFLVMEFAANGSLHTVLAQHQRTQRPLAEDTVWRYTIQLLLGLHAIHMRRVVHRDIKPHNIFLGEGDVRARAARSSDLGADYLPPGLLSPWPAVSPACCLPALRPAQRSHARATTLQVVKIGDFGVSRMLTGSADLATTLVGSPGYLAPEVSPRALPCARICLRLPPPRAPHAAPARAKPAVCAALTPPAPMRGVLAHHSAVVLWRALRLEGGHVGPRGDAHRAVLAQASLRRGGEPGSPCDEDHGAHGTPAPPRLLLAPARPPHLHVHGAGGHQPPLGAAT